MKTLLALICAALLSLPAAADQHGAADAELRGAIEAFNQAYLTNDVEAYFDFFDEHAHMYWGGQRQTKSAYHKSWSELVASGGGVEKDEVSDLAIRLLPGGRTAIASYFIDYRLRTPGGEVVEEQAFETGVWQIMDGKWKVVGLHYSTIPAE